MGVVVARHGQARVEKPPRRFPRLLQETARTQATALIPYVDKRSCPHATISTDPALSLSGRSLRTRLPGKPKKGCAGNRVEGTRHRRDETKSLIQQNGRASCRERV